MPGKKGIDTRGERSYFKYKPSAKLKKRDYVSIHDRPKETIDKQDILPEDQKFLDEISSVDDDLKRLKNLIDTELLKTSVPFSSVDNPDVRRAADYFSIVEGVGTSDNAIDGNLYKTAIEAHMSGTSRVFGQDPMGIDNVSKANQLISAVKEQDDETVLMYVGRYILSVALEYLADLVPNVIPLNKLRNKLRKAADSFRDTPQFTMPPAMSYEEYRDDGDDDSRAGEYIPIDYTTARLRPEMFEQTDMQRIAMGGIIANYVEDKARTGDIEGNPVVFYAAPLHEAMSRTHMSTKMALEPAIATMFSDETSETFMTEDDKEWVDKWASADYKDYRQSLSEISKAEYPPLRRNISWDKLKGIGMARFHSAINTTIATLEDWTKSPDVICCLVRALGVIGDSAESLRRLYAIRALLRYLINGIDIDIQKIHNALPGLFLIMYQALVSRLISLLDGPVYDAFVEMERWTNKLYGKPVIRGCLPLDELIEVLKVEIPAVRFDIISMVGAFVAQYNVFQQTYHGTAVKLEKRFRLTYFLKIVDAIIKGIEQGTLCREIRGDLATDHMSVKDFKLEDLNSFLGGTMRELMELPKTRRALADIQHRDPITGEPVGDGHSPEGVSDDLARAINDCRATFTQDNLDEIARILKEG